MGNGKLITKSFKCPVTLEEDIKWLAKVLGVSQSAVVRIGIELLVKSLDNNGHSRVKVRHVEIRPPSEEEVRHTAELMSYTPRKPTCGEVVLLRYQYDKSWAEIADYYGYSSKYTMRNWFKEHCDDDDVIMWTS